MITFNLSEMNASQLAKLYKLLVTLEYYEDAQQVYYTGIANCSAEEFCDEVAKA